MDTGTAKMAVPRLSQLTSCSCSNDGLNNDQPDSNYVHEHVYGTMTLNGSSLGKAPLLTAAKPRR